MVIYYSDWSSLSSSSLSPSSLSSFYRDHHLHHHYRHHHHRRYHHVITVIIIMTTIIISIVLFSIVIVISRECPFSTILYYLDTTEPCYSFPCMNGGTCVRTKFRLFECQCRPGWFEGNFCERGKIRFLTVVAIERWKFEQFDRAIQLV